VLGFIGSFYSYEGLTLLIEAMRTLRERDRDLRLVLVGGGQQDALLRRMAKDLGVADIIVFAGRVPHDEVDKYYDLMDAMIYPRLPVRVTEIVTPLKPLEAMAGGRLVIASDVGGHKELIRDRETGLLFKAGDARALADTVMDAFERAPRDAIRAAARRYVETERSWAGSVDRYRDVYARLTGSVTRASLTSTN
jgi:glycogen synthase